MNDPYDLTDAERFDLGRQLRIAERNRRTAMRMGNERVRRARVFAWWGVTIAIATIIFGLTLTINTVHLWSRPY